MTALISGKWAHVTYLNFVMKPPRSKLWKEVRISFYAGTWFSKIKTLEGGMMTPSRNHPSIILAWVKVHKLPFESWTAESFSRIESAIGKPLYDDLTTEKRRIDYARICVEIDAKTDLPNEIQIMIRGDSVVVLVEYQWLSNKCSECNVFCHSCQKKATVQPLPTDSWQTVTRNKDSSSITLEVGGISSTETTTILSVRLCKRNSKRGIHFSSNFLFQLVSCQYFNGIL